MVSQVGHFTERKMVREGRDSESARESEREGEQEISRKKDRERSRLSTSQEKSEKIRSNSIDYNGRKFQPEKNSPKIKSKYFVACNFSLQITEVVFL